MVQSNFVVFVLIVRVAAVIHGCGSGSVTCCNGLQLLEQPATEQLNARRGAEFALVVAEHRIAQLDQAFWQGARLTAPVGQVVDTRVLSGRPDKWDGSEKALAKMELRDEGLRREPSTSSCRTDVTSAEISTDVLSNDSMAPRKQSRSVQLYFVLDHVVCWQSFGSDQQCSAWLGHGGVADALSSVFPE